MAFTLSSGLSVAVELLAGFVAPPRCAACDSRVRALAVFCAECASTVDPIEPARPDSCAAFGYGGAIAQAIGRLKYEARPDLARPLGDLLARALYPHAEALRDAVVIPVPLHPYRLAERGYNQSALIARRVARALGTAILPVALIRTRDTPAQAALDRAARGSNVVDAFRVRDPARLRGRAVLLVDDVKTTGATIKACRAALLKVHATSIADAVVARALPAV